MANHLTIERVGGLAGFGGPSAKIRGRGRLDLDELSAADRAAVDALFANRHHTPHPSSADAFRYKISRGSGAEAEMIEVPEGALPPSITGVVKDELV